MKIERGEILANTSIGIGFAEKSYAPNLKLPKHFHEQTYFCFVLEGSFTETYGGRSRLGRASTLIFNPAGETHTDYFHTTTRCFDIQIDSCWLERVAQFSDVINTPKDFYGGRLAFLATRLYREFRIPDEFSSIAIEGLMLEIMAEASRSLVKNSERTPPRWLQQVKENLHEQFNRHLTLVDLAKSVGVHPTHLAREFHKFYNCTVGDYVRQRRIDFACHKISTTGDSFSEIALAAGFFDQSHFARTFKTQTGMTPKQYRKLSRSR